MDEPKVSIVILNWNGKHYLTACLKSLKNINYTNFDIMVVDNGSTDGSCQFLRSNFPDVTVLENEENLGFAEGNNVGIRGAMRTRADYILLLNNDTVVDPLFLKELIDVAENDRQIGIVGPKVYFMDEPSRICFAGGKRKWTTEWQHIGLEEIDKGQYNEVKETEFIYGCVLLLKREVIEKIGMLDADYFAYVEEIDLNYRAKQAGYKIVFVPHSKIWHKVGASDAQGRRSSVRIYYITRNNLLFLKNNGSLADIMKFSIFVLPKWLTKAVLSLVSETDTSRAMFRAFKDFLLGRFGKVRLE